MAPRALAPWSPRLAGVTASRFGAHLGLSVNEGDSMDKDRVEGAAKQVKGAIKETIGKVTGDTKTQAEGAAEKAAGKVQNTVGGMKDSARDALKK
jgi:uncharacterized protein YjbJ (UPF0337 family)